MSMTDLMNSAELYQAYVNLQNAHAYATQWANTVINNNAILSNNPLWAQNVSADDIAFVTAAVSANSALLAVKVPPLVLQSAAPIALQPAPTPDPAPVVAQNVAPAVGS